MSKKISDKTIISSNEDLDEIKKDLAEIKQIVKTFKKELKGLVEIQQRLVHERLGVAVPISPKEYGEEPNSKTKIDISSLPDGRIKVSGKTFDFKSAIKDSGYAQFDLTSKAWTLPGNCLNKLILNFEAINLVKNVDFTVNIKENEEKEDEFGSEFT
jgi:hypothetical protein